MKSCLLTCIFIFTLFFTSHSFGQDAKLQIYVHEARGGYTNIWRVSLSRIQATPWWKVGEKPPLSLDKAIEIAKTNVLDGGESKDFWIDDVDIHPVIFGFKEKKGQSVYFYNICFSGPSFAGYRRRCIVLMDGTVVQPEWLGTGPKDVSWSSYDE